MIMVQRGLALGSSMNKEIVENGYEKCIIGTKLHHTKGFFRVLYHSRPQQRRELAQAVFIV